MNVMKEISWWLEQSLTLVELHDRSELIKLIYLNNIFLLKSYSKYFNYFDGRNGIPNLFSDLKEMVDNIFPGTLIFGMYKHYLFTIPRILPYYKRRKYPHFISQNNYLKKTINIDEKEFINSFSKDFNIFLEKLEKNIAMEFINISLKRKITTRIKILKERLEFLVKII